MKVNVSSGEEDEEEIFKMRAKLYRYDPGDGTEDNEVKVLMECVRMKSENTASRNLLFKKIINFIKSPFSSMFN